MFEWIATPEAWVSLATLTAMEIVLGIDNIVFITILCGDLPEEHRTAGIRMGIGVALISRLALLGVIGWVMQLDKVDLFRVPLIEHAFTGRDLILLAGGLFLIGKATHEIYENVETPEAAHIHAEGEDRVEDTRDKVDPDKVQKAILMILGQVILMDLVFSIDSVITAVGMADHISVMATAIVIAVGVMLIFAGPVGDFVERTPSVRILALSFLILIGVMLVMDSTGSHVSKGYIYSAMGFALFVEVINLRRRRNVQGSTPEDEAGETASVNEGRNG